jgi:hypothetical protein
MSVKSAYQTAKLSRRRVITSADAAPTSEKAQPGTLWIKLDSNTVYVQAGVYGSPVWLELAEA